MRYITGPEKVYESVKLVRSAYKVSGSIGRSYDKVVAHHRVVVVFIGAFIGGFILVSVSTKIISGGIGRVRH